MWRMIALVEALSRRKLKTGRQPTQAELASGKRPRDMLWGVWLPALKAFKKKQSKKGKKPVQGTLFPSKSKSSSYSPMAHFNPKAMEKHTEPDAKVRAEIKEWHRKRTYVDSKNWAHVLKKSVKKGKLREVERYVKEAPGNWKHLKKLGLYEFIDKKDKHTHASWSASKGSSWKPKPKKKLTPDQEKLRALVADVRKKPIPRTAAGGIVIKDWDAETPRDLLVLVPKTHPKWGGYWTLPKGGVDKGESITKGALREVREETNVKAKVIHPSAYVRKGWQGSQRGYDVALVIETLKKKHPKEAKFFDDMKKDLKEISFAYANTEHYFLMQWVSGKPFTKPDPHEEMGKAVWMPIAKARKLSGRHKEVIDKLMPEIEKRWSKASGKPVPPKKPRTEPKKPKLKQRSLAALIAKAGDESDLDW